MSRIRGFMKGWQSAKETNSQDRARSIDALTQRAALDEAGYETPDALFGGQTLKRNEQFGQAPEGYVRVGGKYQPDRSPGYQAKMFGQMMSAVNGMSPVQGQSADSEDYEGQPADGYQDGEMVDDTDDQGNVIASYEVQGGTFRRVS
jgi:hypothetical protein